VDFVNGQKASFFSSVDLRPGEPGLKLFLPLGKADALLFADFSPLVTSDPVSGRLSTGGLDSTRFAMRLDATLGGFELGISGLAGSTAQARAGLDFSGDVLGWAVYGEAALEPAYSAYSESFSASLGLSRALGDLKRWTLSAEGFYESTGSDYTGQGLLMSALPPLYMGRAYGFLSLKADELLSRYLNCNLYALVNLSDLSYSLSLEGDFSFPRSPPFSLILSYAGGGAYKEFTFVAGDRSLSVTARTLIEF
jgi:hypothetical protein